MRREQTAGQRQREVRRAARAWHRAAWIDAATLAEIERLHADDRRRQGPALRILLGVLAAFALSSGFFVLRLLFGLGTFSASWFFFEAAVCALLTELQFGPLRFDGHGTETATALLGYGSFVLASGSLLVDSGFERFGWLAAVAALAGFAAAWRWGSATLAAAGTIAGFAAFTQVPWSRAAWIVTGCCLALISWRARHDPRRAPAHRLAAALALCLAVGALLVAFHPSSNEAGILEANRFDRGGAHGFVLPPPAAWAATFILTAGLCATGIRRRDRLILLMGLVGAAVFSVTLAVELRPRPPWLVLTVAGGLLVAATIAIGRWLEKAPRGERRGWTTDPLAGGLASTPIESVAALATAAAAASTTAVESNAAPPRGEGGEFGGGGASGSF